MIGFFYGATVLPTYTVAPDPHGRYALSGPLLPYAIRFGDDVHAVSHGHHLCRDTGDRIVILDSRGQPIIAEYAEAAESGLRLFTGYRQSAPPARDPSP